MAKNAIYNGKPFHIQSEHTYQGVSYLNLEPAYVGSGIIHVHLSGADVEEVNTDPTDSEWAFSLDNVGLHEEAQKVRPLASYGSTLEAIVSVMDGREWDANTCDEIACLLRGAGFEIREPIGDIPDYAKDTDE